MDSCLGSPKQLEFVRYISILGAKPESVSIFVVHVKVSAIFVNKSHI